MIELKLIQDEKTVVIEEATTHRTVCTMPLEYLGLARMFVAAPQLVEYALALLRWAGPVPEYPNLQTFREIYSNIKDALCKAGRL